MGPIWQQNRSCIADQNGGSARGFRYWAAYAVYSRRARMCSAGTAGACDGRLAAGGGLAPQPTGGGSSAVLVRLIAADQGVEARTRLRGRLGEALAGHAPRSCPDWRK